VDIKKKDLKQNLFSDLKTFRFVACGVFSIFIGLIIIIGWLFKINPLIQIRPDFLPSVFNSGIGFLLMGAMLLLYPFNKKVWVKNLAILIILLGTLSLCQDIFNLNFGIDQLLIKQDENSYSDHPGRIAPLVSLCFVLMGTSLVVRLTMIKSNICWAIESVIFALATSSLIEYFSETPRNFGAGNFDNMSINSAVCFSIVSLGLISEKLIHQNLFLLITLSLFFIFFADITIRESIGIENLYIIPITVCSLYFDRKMVFLMAWLCSVFIGLEFFIGLNIFQQTGLASSIANRFIALIAVWFNSLLGAKINTETMNNLQAKGLMQAILDATPNPIFSINKQGILSSANKSGLKFFGYEEHELIGENVNKLMPSPYKEEHDQYLKNYQATGEKKVIGRNREVVAIKKDGTIFPAKLNVGETILGGEPHFTGIITDLTELKKREEDLVFLNSQLVSSNKELERFAYISSHDLQTPLRHIMAYTNIINEKALAAKLDISEEANIIKSGIERMKNLITALLSYSRVGRGEISKEKVDLNSLLNELLTILDTKIKDRSAEIIVLPITESVYGNKILISQLFQNLLENALKFCPKERTPKIQISSNKIGFNLKIAIKDNGVGIDTEFHEIVFDVFQRLNRREDFEGTGIGLSICKKIVEKHKGKIWLESKRNKGSTFFFTLPIFQIKEHV
jgi:PAS domain S-box-containing protein